MNILEIAKKTDCGLVIKGASICIETGKDSFYAINYELSHLVKAVIEDYKASLVPVAETVGEFTAEVKCFGCKIYRQTGLNFTHYQRINKMTKNELLEFVQSLPNY